MRRILTALLAAGSISGCGFPAAASAQAWFGYAPALPTRVLLAPPTAAEIGCQFRPTFDIAPTLISPALMAAPAPVAEYALAYGPAMVAPVVEPAPAFGDGFGAALASPAAAYGYAPVAAPAPVATPVAVVGNCELIGGNRVCF